MMNTLLVHTHTHTHTHPTPTPPHTHTPHPHTKGYFLIEQFPCRRFGAKISHKYFDYRTFSGNTRKPNKCLLGLY